MTYPGEGDGHTQLHVQIGSLTTAFTEWRITMERRMKAVEAKVDDALNHCNHCAEERNAWRGKHVSEHRIAEAKKAGVAELLRAGMTSLAVLGAVAGGVAALITILVNNA